MTGLTQSIGLLLLRISFAGMMLIGHGWPKLAHFQETLTKIGNPVGIGPFATACLAIFAEFFCSVLVMLGIGVRLSVIPLIITMLVAAVVVHGSEGFAKQEMALLYLVGFVAILILGGGRFSLDGSLWKWSRNRKSKS